MAPPAYGDLGKASRDLFSKHYHFGIVKLDINTKTPTGVEFNVNGISNNGSIDTSLETKYNIKSHGITLKQKWNTENLLTGEITAQDYFVRGLKTGVAASFAPQKNKRTGKLICGYKSLFFNLNGDVDFNQTGAVFNGSGVFGYLGWLAGMKMTFDPTKNKLSKSNVAIGYQAPELHVTGFLSDGQEFNCSIYQRLSDELEGGVNVAWTSSDANPKFGVGCHYRLEKDSAVRVKFDSASQIGIAFVHRLRPKINLTLSTQLDGKDFNHGGHKLGLGLNFEA